MNAAALIRELADAGVTLTANDDRLHVEAPSGIVTETMRRTLVEHKAEIVNALHAAELPARVRVRFRDCCARLGIEPDPILRQFDDWRYTARDLADMDSWPDEIVETHTRLLLDEINTGMKP